jgi:hypothetical protein
VATAKAYESPDGLLRFLVVRDEDGDVSLRFDRHVWHTHGDVLAATYRLPEEAAIDRFIDDLLGNRIVITVSRRKGAVVDIWATDNPQGDLRYKPENESIEFRYWDGSPVV